MLTLLTVWGFVSTHLPEQGASSVTTPESVPEEPSITEPANLVPDFVGLDYDAQVRNNRSYVGDYLFYVTLEYSDTVAEGKIIRQEPAAGELLEEGGTISLVVSKGPEMIEMPNVIGFTQEGAVKELESRGLVPAPKQVPAWKPGASSWCILPRTPAWRMSRPPRSSPQPPITPPPPTAAGKPPPTPWNTTRTE